MNKGQEIKMGLAALLGLTACGVIYIVFFKQAAFDQLLAFVLQMVVCYWLPAGIVLAIGRFVQNRRRPKSNDGAHYERTSADS